MRWLLLAVFIGLLLVPVVHAQDFHQVQIEIDLQGVALVRNLFILNSTGVETFFVPAFSPENIQAYDNSGNLEHNFSRGFISVHPRSSESYSFTVEYLTDELTSKNASVWEMRYRFSGLGDYQGGVTVSLPENAKLISQSPQGVVSSRQGKIAVDFPLPSNGEQKAYSVGYSIEETKSGGVNSVPILVPIIIIAVAAGALAFKRRQKRGAKPAEKQKEGIEKIPEKQKNVQENEDQVSEGKQAILKTLSVNEKKIVDFLLEEKKGVTQKNIMLKTGIPKATLSRTLKGLERKNITSIREFGTTNLVELSEWFLGR